VGGQAGAGAARGNIGDGPGGPVTSVPMNGSYISVTNGELRGIPTAQPVLQLAFNVEAAGLLP
jgi:hypothetical protein